jgi:hypothetical protein
MGKVGRRQQAGRQKVEGKSHERMWIEQPARQKAARQGAGRKASGSAGSRGDMQAEGRAAGRDEGAGIDDRAGKNESGR